MPQTLIDLPDDWWKRASTPRALAQCFHRFMLPLHLIVQVDGQVQQEVYTGFLLYHAERIVWATAGHIVDQLLAIRDHPKAKILRAARLDNSGIPGANSVPAVDFRNIPLLTGTPFGFDVGAASLHNAAMMLAGNPNLDVFHEFAWRNRTIAAPEGFYLIGFPGSWCEKGIDPTGATVTARIEAEMVCVPVEKIDRKMSPPDAEKEFWDHPDSFFGRVMQATNNADEPLNNIDGTSGGTLLSIERTFEGRMKYRLFGIQSAWLAADGSSESRITRAEPIEALAELLERLDRADVSPEDKTGAK